jgi:hypothetical protein
MTKRGLCERPALDERVLSHFPPPFLALTEVCDGWTFRSSKMGPGCNMLC